MLLDPARVRTREAQSKSEADACGDFVRHARRLGTWLDQTSEDIEQYVEDVIKSPSRRPVWP